MPKPKPSRFQDIGHFIDEPLNKEQIATLQRLFERYCQETEDGKDFHGFLKRAQEIASIYVHERKSERERPTNGQVLAALDTFQRLLCEMLKGFKELDSETRELIEETILIRTKMNVRLLPGPVKNHLRFLENMIEPARERAAATDRGRDITRPDRLLVCLVADLLEDYGITLNGSMNGCFYRTVSTISGKVGRTVVDQVKECLDYKTG